ncbi:hypothetical protein ZWY2020_005687 [Hordeum vulgare]|nr:hypothetical protein ZWY2020_005687 [Hordeum vulgare]
MKSLLGEERSFIIESDDDDDEEDPTHRDGAGGGHGDDGSSSDSSSCASPRGGSGGGGDSQPNSYTNQWPQSYRQSIDILSSVQSPSLGFLGTPTLSRLSNSFLNSSFLNNSFRGKTPEVISNIVKPLIRPTTSDEQQQQQQHHEDIRRAHSEDQKPLVVGREVSPYQQCSYTQGSDERINVLCGVGILSTPYAIKQRWWIGLVILIVFALLAWYTGVRRCFRQQGGPSNIPRYRKVVVLTFFRLCVWLHYLQIILYVELYVTYNLSKLFPNVHLNIWGLAINSHVFFAILTTLVVMPTTWLRDLTCLSYISEQRDLRLNLPGIPIAIGLYGYCYCIGFSTILFTAAVMGYKMFGESTESQFTLNLPENLVVSKIAAWATVANPITKYPWLVNYFS